ncbi:unnamed protein product [Brugia pahangi]|uniref:DUF1758 domain-containing protein n=1 Tax=Brugia pahangi TaxID=6280 RepID=A0A0N4T6H3_BRUPA|nr:unnamed protein product [Brugia pahangi]
MDQRIQTMQEQRATEEFNSINQEEQQQYRQYNFKWKPQIKTSILTKGEDLVHFAIKNCLKVKHNTRNCKTNQKSCFHCKQNHNFALCYIFQRRDQSQQNKSKAVTNINQREEVKAVNALADRNIQKKYNVLLLCRKVAVVNPQKPGIKAKVLAFFDIGSQLSFMSKNLANQLRIKGKNEILHIAGFGKERLIEFPTMKTVVGIRLSKEETIQMEISTVDHLTNDLQVADLPDQNLEQIKELHDEWEKPDLLIGAN